jgi:hypothetical protein
MELGVRDQQFVAQYRKKLSISIRAIARDSVIEATFY